MMQSVIDEPPLEGADPDRPTCVLPAVVETVPTWDEVVTGVADAELEYDPVPTEFTAATLKQYCCPFVRLVTVAVVPVEVPSEKVNQVELSVEY